VAVAGGLCAQTAVALTTNKAALHVRRIFDIRVLIAWV
jgi:hypothetical protein